MTNKITSVSERQTWKFAQKIVGMYAKDIKEGGIVLALEGELGAGKTTFTQGLGEILDITRPIRSPGYILVSEYLFNLNAKEGKLIHADLWRVQDKEEALKLGITDFIKPGNIVVIEWAHKVPELIDDICSSTEATCVRIAFHHKGENIRDIEYEKLI